MKRTLQVLAAFLLLAVTGTATTTMYAVVSGTVDIEGPTLYTEPAPALHINDKPATGTYNMTTGETSSFSTDTLDESMFYSVQGALRVTARSNVTTNVTATWRFTNATATYTLCSTVFQLSSSSYTTHSDTCAGSVTPVHVQRFYYRFTTTAINETGIIQIKTGEPTRIEVNAQ